MNASCVRVSTLTLIATLMSGANANAQLAPNPSLTLEGAGLTAAIGGAGLSPVRSGNISVLVNGPVQVAYLYWNGDGLAPGPQELTFGGVNFAGTQIGSEFAGSFTLGYRADVTAVVQNSFVINGPGGLNFSVFDPSPADNLDRMHGAGLFVVYSDQADPAEYRLLAFDGIDYAWSGFQPGPGSVTEPITFSYDSAAVARNAELMVLVGECSADRPDRIDVSDNASIVNALNSSDGTEWDSDLFAINVPAGTTNTTVEVVSPHEFFQSDSLVWQLAALRIPLDEAPGGGEGCTPGYWKQAHHFDSWTAPYTPNMLFSDVFENAFPGKTLLQVLKLGGGGLEALGRHSVAALLNSASAGVSYDLTTTDVINMFNAAYPGSKQAYNNLKDIFQSYNEQGCPLN